MMSHPKMLIVGKDGYLGSHLFQSSELNRHFSLIGTSRTSDFKFDLRNGDSFSALQNYLTKIKPKYMIITAAIPDVEKCSKDPSETRAVNVTGTKKLLELALHDNVIPIFFSSDYVLKPATELCLLKESDECSPQTEYGRQKLEVEQWIEKTFEKFIIFRTSKLMSTYSHPKNILSQTVSVLKTEKKLTAFSDQWMTPVFLEDITKILCHKALDDISGIYHLSSREVYSRFELALAIKDKLGLGSEYEIIMSKLKDFQSREPRPFYNTLDSSKICSALNFKFMEISAFEKMNDF